MEKIVVVVEEAEVARTALKWALHNILRCGDVITLLHVYSTHRCSKSKKKLRRLRLKGFQLALSFRDICNSDFVNTKTEIVVTEGDDEGRRIAAVVREVGASTLVVGLHDRSFLYSCTVNWCTEGFNSYSLCPRSIFTLIWDRKPRKRLIAPQNNSTGNLNCKVLAIKEPTSLASTTISIQGCSTEMDFSQIEMSVLSVPQVPPQKIPYQICPDPNAICWRSRPTGK